MRYLVYILETSEVTYEVNADTPEQARIIALDGNAQEVSRMFLESECDDFGSIQEITD